MDPTAASTGSATGGLTATPGASRSLPPVSVYIRTVVALGLGSLKRGLPAVVFLYFYRLGMGLYLAFAAGGTSSLDGSNQEALIATLAMEGVAYLPLLALIYTPFLPLQDSILSGGQRSLFESMRAVLERFVPFVVSLVAQGFLLFGPPTLLFAGAALMLQSVRQAPQDLARAVALLALVPCVLWMLLLAVLLMFAIPALVLDSRGPIASIRLSLGLAMRHFGALAGRLFVFFLLAMLVTMVASLPEAILQVASAATGSDAPLFRIARVIWSSGVSALLFPFSVAALTVLYRALVPGGGAVPARAAAETAPATSPFRFE